MTKSILLLFLTLILLGGCTTTFTHSTKGINDFERDKESCELAARKTLAAQGIT
jgi:uncharacterized protein YceK